MLKTLSTTASPRGRRYALLLDPLLMLVVVAAFGLGLQRGLALSAMFPFKVIAGFSIGAALTAALALRRSAMVTFGAANRVTLLRAGLVAVLFGFIGEADVAWTVVAVAASALALDGVDGWLARRLGSTSDFGARFDMETDALALLVLTVLVWQDGKAGVWILLAGLMRYGFVAAAHVLPALGGPLPPSWRRKAVFVVQAISLVVCLAPIVTSPLSDAIALAGLLLLSVSFGIDSVALLQVAPGTQSRA